MYYDYSQNRAKPVRNESTYVSNAQNEEGCQKTALQEKFSHSLIFLNLFEVGI